MCVALPVKIVKINDHLATVDIGDSQTSIVDVSIVDANPGDYIIVNAGYAIRVVDKEEAQETIKIWEQLKEVYNNGP
ncbi:MAG: HypC/HybG/HupF family hydrogenase formation chaperone [Candidatus Kariarchaeaceae archaeon]|jgi:hydrogenase expression/formation protein HypC